MEEILIHGAGSELQGVGRMADGRAAFVPGALPGERVRVEVTKNAQRFCEARLCEVLEASEARRTPDCPYYGRCGGCQARHMTYEETLKLKRTRVVDALQRIGGVERPEVRSTIGCVQPNRARNKAEFPIGRNEKGEFVIGAYAPGSHKVVALDDCLLQKEPAAKALKWFAKRLKTLPCAAHLTALVTRVNREGALMATICADAPVIPEIQTLIPEMTCALPELKSIYFLKQNRRPAHALDGACSLLWGERTLEDTLLGLSFELSPQSFFQVNPEQTEILYEQALCAAGLSQDCDARVLDAYCGAGTITLAAARRTKFAVGVEIVAPAIADAKRNAKKNGLENRARFLCADAAQAIPSMIVSGERFDAAILDPPRKGADEALLKSLAKAEIPRIAYVSCDPATLARDVKRLSEHGYRLEWAQPVDMFPWTGHVETVVLLSKGEVDL